MRKSLFHVNLIRYCATRFIQRHDAIIIFPENLEYVVHGLEIIIQNIEFTSKSRSLALSYLNYITNSSFLVSLAVTNKAMSLTMTLSKFLQKVNLDIGHALSIVDATIH